MQTVKPTYIELKANIFDQKHEQPFKRRKRAANMFSQEKLFTTALSQLNPISSFHIQATAQRGKLLAPLEQNLPETC